MTIKDLASQTGYSVGTVSRVLNNQPNVSDRAREVIQDAADACGFQLNTNAKQLKQNHSNTILVIMKGILNELFSVLLETIQQGVADTPYTLTMDYMDEDENEVQEAIRLFRQKKPVGILFLGGNYHHFQGDFQEITCPCVLVTNDGSALPFRNLSSVCSDNYGGARTVIDHLVEMGHRKIGIIGGDRRESDTARLRYYGCLEAFRTHGIEFDPEEDYETVRCSYEDGYQGIKSLMEKDRGYTAVFAMADVVAIGAIRAAQDAGKQVPGDISVAGFDGLKLGEYTFPRLATVRQNAEEMGKKSVELLLSQIETSGEPIHEMIPVAPLWRESIQKAE